MMSMSNPIHLQPSELGTKEHWDSRYTTELSQTPPSPTSSLDGWFSDVDASSKTLKYLTTPALALDKDSTTFLDLGTGNGEMLFLLREEGGFSGRMIGVDYSEQSIALCKRIAESKGLVNAEVDEKSALRFFRWDIVRDSPWGEAFNIVLDKGTFDAVSLSDEKDEQDRRLCEGYRESIEPLVKEGGLFVVTSCNWTERELKGWFEGGELEAIGRVEYPVFTFGGQTGQSISTVCFKRKGSFQP